MLHGWWQLDCNGCIYSHDLKLNLNMAPMKFRNGCRFVITFPCKITACCWEIPRGWFNINMSSYQYRKSHCGDNTTLWPSYLHNRISFTDKTTSLCWNRAQKLELVDIYSLNSDQEGILGKYRGWSKNSSFSTCTWALTLLHSIPALRINPKSSVNYVMPSPTGFPIAKSNIFCGNHMAAYHFSCGTC